MRMLFKQRLFSWFDSYDIYDEYDRVLFSVEGQLSWGRRLHILNAHGEHVGTLKQRVLTFLPRFELYYGEEYMGCITKEFSFFRPRYTVEGADWEVEGDFWAHDYTVFRGETPVVSIQKEWFTWGDCYALDIRDPADEIQALALVLAIDGAIAQQNN